MEGSYIFRKNVINITHLPTAMLGIGYVVFWIELYFLRRPKGHTTPLAGILFGLICIIAIFTNLNGIALGIKKFKKWFQSIDFFMKCLLAIGSVFAAIILACTFYVSLFPPHLIQETDTLVYHLTMPRQHLILGSFKHIPWSLADLYFLPLDFALAPYMLVTELPNKFPHYLFLLGLIGVASRVIGHFTKNNFLNRFVIVFMILGTHAIGIQMGLAMLDIVMCYLFIAALDSFLNRNIFLCAIEIAFYFWSKSFIPIQMCLVIVSLLILNILVKTINFRLVGWTIDNYIKYTDKIFFKKMLRKIILLFMLISIFVGGPFLGKSLYYAATPLFPFSPGICNINTNINKESLAWKSLVKNAQTAVATKDQYGSGRSPIEFIRHLWLIAVPEKGVNNRYDYPVGLIYLLCLVPFMSIIQQSIKKKEFLILPSVVVISWIIWWIGSHQSRFLFIPIVLMYITVIAQKKFCTKIMICSVIFSMGLVSLSVVRAHCRDFGLSAFEVLRIKDKRLIQISKNVPIGKSVKLDFYDVAFANFSVDVQDNNSVFVLKY